MLISLSQNLKWILSSLHWEFVAEDDNWSGKVRAGVSTWNEHFVAFLLWWMRVTLTFNPFLVSRSHARWLKCFTHWSTWPSHSQSQCRISHCWFWKFVKMGQTSYLRSALWNAAPFFRPLNFAAALNQVWGPIKSPGARLIYTQRLYWPALAVIMHTQLLKAIKLL